MRDHRDQVRAAALAGIEALIARHAGKPGAMLQRHGFARESAMDPEQFVSYADFIRLLEDCALTLACPDFGLRFAAIQDIQVLGPVATIVRFSDSVADAVSSIRRYVSYHTPGASVELVAAPDGPAGFTFEVTLPGLSRCRQINELSMYLGQRMLELLLGEAYRAQAVHFANEPPQDLAACRRTFGKNMEFGMPINRFVMHLSDLQRTVPRADPALRHLVSSYIDLTRRDSAVPLIERVERAVRLLLPSGRCSMKAVADHLGYAPRSLQRELERGQRKYRQIQEQEQRRLAESLLENSRIPLLRVATMAGFAEQSTFVRAFRRWTGCPPGRWRREHQADSQPPGIASS